MFSYEVFNDDINRFSLLFSIWFSFKHYFNVKNIIKSNSIDLVHIHNFYPLLTPSVFKAAKVAGAKVVHTLHNYRLWCISGILYRDQTGHCELCTQKKAPIYGVINRCYRKSTIQSFIAQCSFLFYKLINAFDHIDYFFVLTSFQKKTIEAFGLPKEKIILKPNSTPSFPKSALIDPLLKTDYIYVGRIEASKGVLILLETWAQLDETFVLRLIGGGEILDKLKGLYPQKNIIFLGQCSTEATLLAISKSKFLIQPSLLIETFGLTIIEAMSLKTPVIGFDIGTRKEFIQNEENGFLCKKDELINVIKWSFDYPDYLKLSTSAKAFASNFETEFITKKQIRIYQKILNIDNFSSIVSEP